MDLCRRKQLAEWDIRQHIDECNNQLLNRILDADCLATNFREAKVQFGLVQLSVALGGNFRDGLKEFFISDYRCDNLNGSADGLVGYDIALTRRGSRVQFPVCVVFLFLQGCQIK